MKLSFFGNAILHRFIKAFLAGAVAGAILVSVKDAHTWNSLLSALNAMSLSAITGGITGFLLAAEKYLTWTDAPPVQG